MTTSASSSCRIRTTSPRAPPTWCGRWSASEVTVAFCGGNPDGGLGTRRRRDHRRDRSRLVAPRASRSSSISAAPRPTARWRSRCCSRDGASLRRRMQCADRRGRRHGGDRGGRRQLARAGAGASPKNFLPMKRRQDRSMEVDHVGRSRTDRSSPAACGSSTRSGMHARPAVKLTKLAKTFQAQISVRVAGAAEWINAKSIAKVMAMRAARGSTIEIKASGERRARPPSRRWSIWSRATFRTRAREHAGARAQGWPTAAGPPRSALPRAVRAVSMPAPNGERAPAAWREKRLRFAPRSTRRAGRSRILPRCAGGEAAQILEFQVALAGRRGLSRSGLRGRSRRGSGGRRVASALDAQIADYKAARR